MSILLSALGLAANQVAQPLVDRAVKNAYVDLRTLIVGRFGAHELMLESILANHAKAPDTRRTVTETALRDAGADRNQEVIEQAIQLLRLLEDAQPGITEGLVGQINAQGGQGVVLSGNVGLVEYLIAAVNDPGETEEARKAVTNALGSAGEPLTSECTQERGIWDSPRVKAILNRPTGTLIDLSDLNEEEIEALIGEAKGMWADHSEITDSVQWVRGLREGLTQNYPEND